jgi:predicted short-subunit dehydrogenase-like oxidoreductase (DUF2520 family)
VKASHYVEGKRQKAKGRRGEGSDSVSPFSRPASGASSRLTSKRRTTTRAATTGDARALGASPTRATSVAVVGAGRLGTALATALASCGYDVRALVSRREASARRAAVLAGVKAVALTFERLGELPPSELLFITTPDDAIAEVAERIAALTVENARVPERTDGRGGARVREREGDRKDARVREKASGREAARGRERARVRVALHASGALSSGVLAPLRACGFRVGSMHPLASVSEPLAGAESLRRAFYCVEGDRAAALAARRVVRDLGGESFSIRPEDKALYHASALITAGHTVALFDIAAGLLARCGLAPARARRVLLPLLQSTLENLSRTPPERALTGTFARGDAETVRKHLAALRAAGEPDSLLAYALLGGRSLRLAARAGADAARLNEIARLLAEALGVE